MYEEKLLLGLDIGPNSLGWAIIGGITEGAVFCPKRLKDAGVRIFAEGVDRTAQGSEISKSAARRQARSARRIHQRRNRRREQLQQILQEAGLLPKDEKTISEVLHENPYKLRADGLTNQLSLHSLGRAIYHLGQRRGFKSNRKSDRKADEGVLQKGRNLLHEKLGGRTVGEYLYNEYLSKGETRFRNIELAVPDRAMYEEEFQRLWDTQRAYYPDLLTENLRQAINSTIFFQRHYDIRERWGKDLETLPLRANARRAPELGICEYEPEERRSPRASWHAQRFRLLQDINNLSVVDTDSGVISELEIEQRDHLIQALGKKKEMTFDQIRKLLGLSDAFKFNLEGGKRTKLKGNSTEWNLRQVFKNYDALSEERRDDVICALLEEEDTDVLKRRAINDWGLDEKGAERLCQSELENGYLHLSDKALRKLVPHLEEGMDYMKAVEAAGYLRRDQRTVGKAGRLDIKDLPELANPLVTAAIYQVRKVVNAIVREYGVPAKIRVEMVRGLKSSRERREEIIWEQRENERNQENARKRLQEDFGITNPADDQILRYKLWNELHNHECPYTGRVIPKEAVLSSAVEIDHILPYSRSLDDSYMNKILCYAGANQAKGNRIPWEFYGHDEDGWNGIIKRVAHPHLPEKKRNKFYLKEIPPDFINRQLNDTAYIAKEVKALLEKVSGKNNVQIGTGQSTAILRRLWGLNTVLGTTGKKNRADHRHHAVDAIVVALTSPEAIKLLSRAAEHQITSRIKDYPVPWEGFRDDVKNRIDSIVVSHRVRRKVSGALHEETNYGIVTKKDEELYAVRKAIPSLTRNEVIKRIADDKVKEIVIEHLQQHGVDMKKDNHESTVWKKAILQPIFLPNRNGPPVPIKKVRLHIPDSTMIHLGHRAVSPGSNHHIVIFEFTEGKKKGQWNSDGPITLFKAFQRLRSKETLSVIQREPENGKRFVMSLSKKEMVRIGSGATAQYYKVQEMEADGRITFYLHTYGGKHSGHGKPPIVLRINAKKLGEMEGGCVKITVDPLGRVGEAHD